MLENLPNRLNPLQPEATKNEALSPVAQTLATIVVTENGSGEEPKLSHASRLPLLASGLMQSAGLVESIAIVSTPIGGRLAGEYLEGIDVPRSAVVLRERASGANDSQILGRMARDNSLGDVVFASSGKEDQELLEALRQEGIDLSKISPEEEIGARIVESVRDSRHAFTELLKQAVLSIGRWERLRDVNFTRLQAVRT